MVDRDRRTGRSVKTRVVGIRLGSQLDSGNVPQIRQTPPFAPIDDDFLELLGFPQSAQCFDRDLKGGARRRWRSTDLPGGNLDVLFPQRGHDVAGCQVAGPQLAGIQPDPHAVVARTENRDFSNAGDAAELIPQIEIGVIAQVQRVEAAVR